MHYKQKKLLYSTLFIDLKILKEYNKCINTLTKVSNYFVFIIHIIFMEVITINEMTNILLNDSYRLLEFIYKNQITILDETFAPLTQEQMAKHLNLTRATINSNLKKLKDNNLIEKSSCNKKYVLTPEGIKFVKTIIKFNEK